jgi:hypothetical protein
MRIILTLAILILTSCVEPTEHSSVARSSVVCSPAEQGWYGSCVDVSGTYDFSADLQAKLDSMPPYVNSHISRPQVVELPVNADLRLDYGVVIDRPIILRGNGSRFLVGDGIVALKLTSPLPNKGGADRSVLEDMWFVGDGKDNGSHAIDARRGAIRVNRSVCLNMESCYKIRGSYGEEGGNANAMRWTNISARSCGTAIDISGGDAQIGLYSGVDVLGCDIGVVDGSAFGNVWLTVSTEGMGGPGFVSSKPAAYPLVLGGYQESGEDSAHIEGRSALVVGGNLAGVLDHSSQADRIGSQSAAITFKKSSGPTVKIPGDGNGDVMSWNWQNGVTSNGQIVYEPRQFRLTWDEAMEGWSFWFGGPKSGINQAIYHGTRAFTLSGGGAPTPAGSVTVHRADTIAVEHMSVSGLERHVDD